ncbi:MAG: hypothetical protein HeimC3_44850 [Candidatus Heimdallarchaeota archaeon LC_3]|nr:MAG: hypothetical protein HeimC3_44850 [Candidatus Heimdallarchaeota archaeon LC_3]
MQLLIGEFLNIASKRTIRSKQKSSSIIKNEINVYFKSLRSIQLRIAVIFPNKYRIGMSNLAIKILYSLWNRFDQVYAERAFLPEESFTIPKSLETGTLLQKFNVLAFTVQFELDYTNILRMLKNSGIPLFRKDRIHGNYPLIIVGGTAVSANPLVLSPFVDIIFIGEIEAAINDLTEGLFYRDFELLAKVDGVYLPSSPPKEIIYARIPDLNATYFPTNQVRNTSDKNWQEMQVLGGFLLQVSRGCNRGCKFCLIGKLTRGGANNPMRERSVEKLLELSLEGTNKTRVDKISLIGSGIGDYSEMSNLLKSLNENKLKFSIPSIRADTDYSVIDEVVKNKQNTITIAPEVGSDDLRFSLAKRITNSQFYEFANYAKSSGIRSMKMYYIIGLPGQLDDEINHMIDFGKKMAVIFRQKRDLNITVGYFIPKRQTSFSQSFIDGKQIDQNEKQAKLLSNGLKKVASLHMPSKNWSIIQIILSIGDESLAPYLVKVTETSGHFQDWVKVLKGDPVRFLEEMQKMELVIPLEIK